MGGIISYLFLDIVGTYGSVKSEGKRKLLSIYYPCFTLSFCLVRFCLTFALIFYVYTSPTL